MMRRLVLWYLARYIYRSGHTCWDGIANLCTECVEMGWHDGFKMALEDHDPEEG